MLHEGQKPKRKEMYNFQRMNDRAKNKKWNKVFCIGLNKTGTTSLHFAFQKLGLCSFHGGSFDSRIDAFSDGRYFEQFIELDKLCPNSKFILNTRDLRDWIMSRIKHCQRGHYTPGWETDSRCDANRIREWVQERWNLHQRIYQYFYNERLNGIHNLLVFDVCAGDGYQKMCPFLGLSRIAEKFPKANTRNEHEAILDEEQINAINDLEKLNSENDPFAT